LHLAIVLVAERMLRQQEMARMSRSAPSPANHLTVANFPTAQAGPDGDKKQRLQTAVLRIDRRVELRTLADVDRAGAYRKLAQRRCLAIADVPHLDRMGERAKSTLQLRADRKLTPK